MTAVQLYTKLALLSLERIHGFRGPGTFNLPSAEADVSKYLYTVASEGGTSSLMKGVSQCIQETIAESQTRVKVYKLSKHDTLATRFLRRKFTTDSFRTICFLTVHF